MTNKKTSQWDKTKPKVELVVPEVESVEETGEITSATQLPDPKGYRILCGVPKIEDKYESGILKAGNTRQVEENSTVVLYVLKMGDMCYKDEQKFPTGAWCQEGDFVVTPAYAGTRIKVHGVELRIINDDTVQAVVDNPIGYSRA